MGGTRRMWNILLSEEVVQSFPVEIAVLDRTGTIVFVNEKWRAFGRENSPQGTSESSVGRNYLSVCRASAELGDPTASETLAGLLGIMTNRLPVFTLEYPCHIPFPEKQRWFRLYAFPLPGKSGYMVVLHVNVTGPKLLVQRLVADNEEMSAYLSLVGHEMRTPLTSIIAYMQLAQRHLRRLQAEMGERAVSGAQTEQLLTMLQEDLQRQDTAAQRLARLGRDLEMVAQIQSGHLELTLELCDLCQLVREVVDEQRLHWPDRDLRLSVPENAVSAPIDRGRIVQVVTNFLTNALKYAPPAAPINIRVLAYAADVRIEVQDRGPGLSQEEQCAIWQRFYRSPNARSQGIGGLGLGLAICRNIILQHHGQIGVASEPGQGATFWFTLPLSD